MAQQTINIGTTANDHTGDPLRTAFQKINSNFTDLYAGAARETQLTNGANTVTLGADGVLDLSANGVIRNQTSAKYINLVANDTVQLQWTTTTGVASSDPNNTAEPSNWLFVDQTGITAQTNFNVSGQPSYTSRFDMFGNLVYSTGNYFNGQTLVDITEGTNYTLKVAHGTTGSVFAVGTGTDAYGVANDALDHTQTTYVPYNATASTISFNVPSKVGSLTINANGIVTVPNGLVIPTGTKASNAIGTVGQITYDASYIYICTATNTWKRSPLTGGY